MNQTKKIIACEQLICAYEDIRQKIESEEKCVEVLRNEKAKLEKELETAGTQLEQAENTNQDLAKRLKYNMEILKEKEEQIQSLTTTYNNMKSHLQVYIPVKVNCSYYFF